MKRRELKRKEKLQYLLPKESAYQSRDTFIVKIYILCIIKIISTLKNEKSYWVSMPGVDNIQDANLKTSQVKITTNKRTILLMKVKVKYGYGLNKSIDLFTM